VSAQAILEVREVSRNFGMLKAVDGVSLRVDEGEVVGIIGTNGSGKTTLVNLVTGYLAPVSGEILFDGHAIAGLKPRQITALGVTRSFQVPQIYTGMSVLENALIAVATRHRRASDFWRALRRPQWLREAGELLERFGLAGHAAQSAANLPEGGRKLLDVAMSFVLQPRLLLMDEPTSGVSAKDKFAVMDTVMNALAERGVTTIFIEHDMEIVERYARRGVAFAGGRIIADGDVSAVLAEPEVRRSVLGVD
jgi:branched-chain amino acid transport system ATP-binding protein